MPSTKLPLQNLANRDDLFYPDLELNIAKILPAALTLFDHPTPKDNILQSVLKTKPAWQITEENEIKNIVFIILDSFGLQHLMKHSVLLKNKFETNGIQLSSVFPTITSTCIASLRLGKMPFEHGIVGHKIFFEEIGNIVDTLNFKAKDSYISLDRAGVDLRKWLWCDIPFQDKPDIELISIIENDIVNSGLSKVVRDNSKNIGYTSHVDCFSALQTVLKKPSEKKRFIDVYNGSIDSTMHRYKTNSHVIGDEIQSIETILFKTLGRLDSKTANETAVFITADHGQENLLEEQKILVNEEEEEELFDFINFRGRSGRVLHLFSKEGKQDELIDWLSEKIADKGVIVKPKDYPKLVGRDANIDLLTKRIGDIQVILGSNASIYFGHDGIFDPEYDLDLNATHGSLSQDELLVPLVFGLASDFRI